MNEYQNGRPQEKTVTKPVETFQKKQEKKVAQLKAKLQKEEAKLSQSRRKERDGQLVAMGVLVETLYKAADDAARTKWCKQAESALKDRNLERVLAAFSRLDSDARPGPSSEAQPDSQAAPLEDGRG